MPKIQIRVGKIIFKFFYVKQLNFLAILSSLCLVMSFSSCDLFTEADPCEDVVCQNGGTCVDGTCDCPEGYSGANCETHCSDNLIGTWTATAGNTGGCETGSYQFTRNANDGSLELSLTNNAGDVTLSADITSISADCSTLTYTETSGAGWTGSIVFNGNTLTDTQSFQNCVITAEKQ